MSAEGFTSETSQGVLTLVDYRQVLVGKSDRVALPAVYQLVVLLLSDKRWRTPLRL